MTTSHDFPSWLNVGSCAKTALQFETDPKVTTMIEKFVRGIDTTIQQLLHDGKMHGITLLKPVYTDSYHFVVNGEDAVIKEVYIKQLLDLGNLEDENYFVSKVTVESTISDAQNS